MEAAPPEPSTTDLTTAVAAGGCRASLVLEQRWVPWSGTLSGALVLQGGAHPETLLSCRVFLTLPTPGGGDLAALSDSQSWELPVVGVGQKVELPFSLKAAWGGPTFGEIGTVSALIRSSSGWWRNPEPVSMSLPVEITPPPEFVRAAAELAGLADLQLGVWQVISGGDGAANTLTSRSQDNPVQRIDLKLFRGPARDYGELVVHPRRGGPRRVSLHLARGDSDQVRETLRASFQPLLAAIEALPIPAGRPLPAAERLPLPSEPRSGAGKTCPGQSPVPEPSATSMTCKHVPVLILTAALGAAAVGHAGPSPGTSSDWPSVNGDPGATRFSRLDQINRRNVRKLQVAWTYRTGDADPEKATNIEATPVVAEGVLYTTTCSPRVKVIALDGATGREIWKYDPWAGVGRDTLIASGGVNRGVAYWSEGEERRVLLATADGRLISLDARTGQPDPGFGKAGVVDLRAGLERDIRKLPYGCTSPGAIYQDLIILGFANGEGTGPGAPGDVRAFNVRTGKQVWRFHTVPRPGEFGHDTWQGEDWKERGGCNNWSGATVDAARGIVFVATGSPAFDFYGGDRKGTNLFGNCVLALDANTGKRLWHYQVVRHDLWDYDNPCPPVLCTVRHNGRTRDAVAQVTKTGFCFVFDRVTGEPLFPIEERPVPASDVPGEAAHPTQVFPLKPPPIAPQTFGPEMVTDISAEARAYVLERIRKMRYGSIFTPTALGTPTVRLPGFHGGASWAGASFDPATGTLYVNSNNIPREHQLERMPAGSPYPYRNTGYGRFVDQNGYPAVKPPWGILNAVDLNRGEFAWREPLGEYPELLARGIPRTGTESLGGTIVTAGGLVFVGGTKDEKFRAFDKRNGKLLWEHKLPYAGYATPCTYSVKGRQYVVIAAAGGGKLATAAGDAYVAYALPRD